MTLEEALLKNDSVFDREKYELLVSEKQEILKKLKDNYAKDSLLTKPYYAQAAIILA